MAAAPSTVGARSNTVSDEERRWVVVGVCLNKVLTPVLRDVLAGEIPTWHQLLLQPPCEIDKQTFRKHEKKLPPSTLKLNYDSINNNIAHKSPRAYDYAVKDPLSLAKLFVKPFMANFTGFDQTMDTSAVLSIMCEAKPFFTSGAAGIAKNVRTDIRNEWAHCNFSHWTEPNFKTAMQTMESLVKKTNLTSSEENKLLEELKNWKTNGIALCFGQAVDPELLKLMKTEVSQHMESVKSWQEDSKSKVKCILEKLRGIEEGLNQQMQDLIKRQDKLEKRQVVTAVKVKKLEKHMTNELSRIAVKKKEGIPYIFHAPRRNRWFSGRQNQIQELGRILGNEKNVHEEKVCVAAVCGLGGIGKTSLVTEYAHHMKDRYKGGVYWFTGEDETKLENSVNDVSMQLGTFNALSFDVTLSGTLQRIAQVGKPWLIVLDCLDQLSHSQNVTKLVSGPWQQGISGHFVIITRRKPGVLINDIQSLDDSCWIRLECFEPEEAKQFLFTRSGETCDDETDRIAGHLVKELGGLPLALEQAAAYIKSLGCTLASYLEQYKVQRLHLLNEQKACPISVYESPERLAVYTTWRLNFNHIKENTHGNSAIRFINACSLLNPNQIQEELINVGEPPVEDQAFRECVATSLGSRQILKLLTDFSLFKNLQGRCVSVHRLVQEVIIENLTADAKAESIADALRMLRFAFSKCPSPDELLSDSAAKQNPRHTFLPKNPSLFYLWSKLCMHSHELRKNFEEFLEDSPMSYREQLFFPETAKIVYESAVHLSVNCRHEEAKQVLNFAYRILDWVPLARSEGLAEKLNLLFPLTIPLPKSLQRVIQQCRSAPFELSKPISLTPSSAGVDSRKSEELEKMRVEGNRLFKQNRFQEAIEVYSSAITKSKATNSFDPTLLSNRASAYLKLGQYDNALKDAEGYIVQCPDCWKGYARKALALHGLNEEVCSELAAALAFYRERKLFRQFEPFKATFPMLERRIVVCYDTEMLSNALPLIPNGADTLSILLLGSEVYDMSAEYFARSRIHFQEDGHSFTQLLVRSCVLLGVVDGPPNSRVSLNFKGTFGIRFENKCMAANLIFKFEQCNSCCSPSSFVKLFNCYFTSRHPSWPGFSSQGQLNVERCEFRDCKAGGLLCCDSGGQMDVEGCTFSGNGKAGLEVRQQGSLRVKSSHMHGNGLDGLVIGPDAKQCIMVACEVDNNKREGISITKTSAGDVQLMQSKVFSNEHYGIFVNNSSAVIKDNDFFENNKWGIWAQSNAWCHVSGNKVFRNKIGGIRVGHRAKGPEFPESIVECNKIYDNVGHGLLLHVNEFEIFGSGNANINLMVDTLHGSTNSLKPARCSNNEVVNNEENVREATAKTQLTSKRCSHCQAKDPSKKCGKCFTTEYCNKTCQERHWKKHKELCRHLIYKSSVLVSSMQRYGFQGSVNKHASGLAPVGPEYSEPPPKDGTRFVVKVQSTSHPHPPNTIFMCDRSLELYETFESRDICHLVQEFGVNCEKKYEEKKLFLQALFVKNGKVRLFTNEFAQLQEW